MALSTPGFASHPLEAGHAGSSGAQTATVSGTTSTSGAASAAPAPRLRSAADPGSAAYRTNTEAHQALVAELRDKLAAAALGGGGQGPRAARRSRQAAAARPGRHPARPGLAVPGALAAGGRRAVRRRGARGRRDHRHRPGRRPRVRGRRQRRHGQGRHLLPDDGQEAPAGAGGRAARTGCPASTWSTPAAPSCRCRTRSSPTATTSAGSSTTRPRMSARGHPADRGRARLLHRRRRLRARR